MIKNTIISNRVKLPQFFIKFGKKDYLLDTLYNGNIRFSPIKSYSKNTTQSNGKIEDSYDGSLYYPIECIVVAPVIKDDLNEYVTGTPRLLADRGSMRITSHRDLLIPILSLYSFDSPSIDGLVKLDNYDDVVSNFPDYDSALIIYNPLEFIKRLENKNHIYANYVVYTDQSPTEFDIDNQIHSLYYKRQEYSSQREFRIVLMDDLIDEPKFITIGPITDIAHIVPINLLKKGIIAKNNEIISKLQKFCEKQGYGVENYPNKSASLYKNCVR